MSPIQIAALVVAYLLAFARLFDVARPLWAFIPAKFQPLAPAVLAAIPALVDAFRGVTSQTELTVAIVGALGTLTTAIRGALPAEHFAKLPPEAVDALREARGGKPKDDPPTTPRSGAFVGLVLAVALLVPALPACSSAPAQVQATQARDIVRVGYAAANMALKTLGDVHHAWMKTKTVESPATQAEIDASAKVLAAFDASRRALETVQPWLQRGDGGDEVKAKLLEALDMALLAVVTLESVGSKVPPEVTENLEAARVLFGGAS